ncbi:MAG: BrnT family toxin [Pseudomonadota bacterium]
MITWDDKKRQINIKKHGIDFASCSAIFDSHMITKEDDREAYGEQRLQSLAMFGDRVMFMVWVEKLHGPHIISIREATKHEQRYYFKNIGF